MALLASVACAADETEVPQVSASTTNSSSSEATSETSPETSTSSTTTTSNETDDTSFPESGSFPGPGVDIGRRPECDPFDQDCPEGEKCVVYSTRGDAWDDNKCVPVLGEGQPGDPCTYSNSFESTDDCGQDSFCFNLIVDEEQQLVGQCKAFCTGNVNDPVCDEGQFCFLAPGIINLCQPTCDPLAQDCVGEADGCYWANGDFICLVTQTSGPGGACDQTNECPVGQACLDAYGLPACESSSCCSDFCDVQDPEACPDEVLECVNFFEQGTPEFEQSPNLGVCFAP